VFLIVRFIFYFIFFIIEHNIKDWFVYISKSKSEFITSDNPVGETFPKIKTFWGASFLDREHYFALSPEIMIHCKYPKKIKKD
jgi:hypothetical protein